MIVVIGLYERIFSPLFAYTEPVSVIWKSDI